MPRTPEERAAKKAEIAEMDAKIKEDKDNKDKALDELIEKLTPFQDYTIDGILNYLDARFKVIEDELGIINILKVKK